jgi:hypothetical protein
VLHDALAAAISQLRELCITGKEQA